MPDTGTQPDGFAAGQVSHAIFQLHVAHKGYAARLLRRIGLHPGQELILMHLHDREPQTQAELLESIGVDASTLSKALLRMQRAGLLVREPAEHDRRVQVVRLTTEGRALRGPIAAMWRELEEVTLQNLSPRQAEDLKAAAFAVVDAINDRTQRHDPPETS
jgi:MarR family transcriptional regulator, organic hydroperoxide resistance regulator